MAPKTIVEERDLFRRIENVAFYGVVAEADYAKARVRVQFADGKTAWIPWVVSRAHEDSTWFAPEVEEQVLVISPSGDPALGVVVGSIFRQKYPQQESDEKNASITFGDGTVIRYNKENHQLSINISQSGSVDITVTGSANINTTENISVSASGSITVSSPSVTFDSSNVTMSGNLALSGSFQHPGTLIER